jgi:hypothetical protein
MATCGVDLSASVHVSSVRVVKAAMEGKLRTVEERQPLSSATVSVVLYVLLYVML